MIDLPNGLRAALAAPVHAYLLVGPPEAATRQTAVAFAAALLCPDGGCGECDVCRRVLGPGHPDVVLLERTGASISVDEAREIGRVAARSPVESERKVIVLTDFHLVDKAAPALLKTIEEPPPRTIFVITAETVSSDLVTIASRCVRIDLPARPVTAGAGSTGSTGSGQDDLWRGIPGRLDGRGATVATVAAQLLEACEVPLEGLRQLQAEEMEAAVSRAKELGERASGVRDLEERHRRQQRRLRVDALRSGLVALSEVYVDRLAHASGAKEVERAQQALADIDGAGRELVRNPNETLLLQALLVRLGR